MNAKLDFAPLAARFTRLETPPAPQAYTARPRRASLRDGASQARRTCDFDACDCPAEHS